MNILKNEACLSFHSCVTNCFCRLLLPTFANVWSTFFLVRTQYLWSHLVNLFTLLLLFSHEMIAFSSNSSSGKVRLYKTQIEKLGRLTAYFIAKSQKGRCLNISLCDCLFSDKIDLLSSVDLSWWDLWDALEKVTFESSIEMTSQGGYLKIQQGMW